MRTHIDIIHTAIEPGTDNRGAHALGRVLHSLEGGDLVRIQKRVRAWLLQGSIPGDYWFTLERAGVATVRELAAFAETQRRSKPERPFVKRKAA